MVKVEKTLHFMLLKAEAALAKQFYLKLSEIKLSPGQPKLLDSLRKYDGCIQKKLAAVCKVESATITNLLARMENAGLIGRRQLPADKRSMNVFLTGKDETLLPSFASASKQSNPTRSPDSMRCDGINSSTRSVAFMKIYPPDTKNKKTPEGSQLT